jgi:glutamate decarboxylase
VQYYNLIHLGFTGYREVMENCLANARILSQSLEATGWYTCLSEIHRPAPPTHHITTAAATASAAAADATQHIKDAITGQPAAPNADGDRPKPTTETSAGYAAGLPVVAFRLTDEFRREYPHIKQETISLLLRARQWIIPNYALPPDEDQTEILRVVIRVSMSFDMLDRLVTDIVQVTETLMEKDEVDLSVLGEQRRGPLRRDRAEGKGKGEGKGDGKVKKGEEEARKVGKEVKRRMAEGIHRSVC